MTRFCREAVPIRENLFSGLGSIAYLYKLLDFPNVLEQLKEIFFLTGEFFFWTFFFVQNLFFSSELFFFLPKKPMRVGKRTNFLHWSKCFADKCAELTKNCIGILTPPSICRYMRDVPQIGIFTPQNPVKRLLTYIINVCPQSSANVLILSEHVQEAEPES